MGSGGNYSHTTAGELFEYNQGIIQQKDLVESLAMAQTAVLVNGMRTPFVGHFGSFMKLDAIGLGVNSVSGLLTKTKLDPHHLDHLIWGNVVQQTAAPNIAREIIIDLSLPRHIPAHTSSMACASSMNTVIQASTFIESGSHKAIIAGGSDSISSAEVPLRRELSQALGASQRHLKKGVFPFARSVYKMLGPPSPKWGIAIPAVAERSTGKTMGWHADLMAEFNGVSREEQEEFALGSHRKAAAAAAKGVLAEEIVPTPSEDKDGTIVKEDGLIRSDMQADKIATMKPVFRKAPDGGSITAATSSALTDGGSAVLVMSAAKARSLGLPADIRMKAWSMCAIDPMPQLLMAPALGIADVLKQTKLSLKDIDVFEIHEAFAAQVLATIKAINHKEFCEHHLKCEPLGEVPREKLNVNGGSLAIGHPFAATGGRVITAAMNELRRSGKQYALCSICAAGGLGSVCIIEHRPGGFQ